MKSKDEINYFTAGEVANLYGISKQAILYYDKVKVLSPEYISENGYRHYCVSQLMDLEIVLNLRSMDFSISCIKSYLQERNLQKFEHLLEKKATDCQKAIRINQNILDSISKLKAQLNSFDNVAADICTIKYYNEQCIAQSQMPPQHTSKDKLICYIQHSNTTFTSEGKISKKVGWIVDGQSFFQESGPLPSKAYFSFCKDNKSTEHTKTTLLPKGFYLEVYINGAYYKKHLEIRELISKYLAENKLHPDSDIYILPIKNHWYTSQTSKYITKVFLKIKEE